MSLLAAVAASNAEDQREHTAFERAAARVRLTKVLCCLVLSVCFWYSVPYQLPIHLDTNAAKAAADEAEAYAGSQSRQIAVPVIALVSLYMLWRLPRRGRLARGPLGGKLAVGAGLYVAWSLLSIAWSEDPRITGKRLIVFGADAFFAYALARTLSALEMALWGFAATGGVAILALYADIVQLHAFAPGDPDYRFMGVMTANYQAMNLVACLLCGLTLVQRRPAWARWLAPALGVAMGLLYLTRSRLGTVVCLLLVAVVAFGLARTRMQPATRAMTLVAVLAVVVPAGVYVVGQHPEQAVQSAFMMGRTDTENTASLSNRAPLWTELSESVAQRPWLGFGYQAFWTPARVERVSADQGWTVPHAHNTYLDQTLSLGIVGVVLYALTLLSACVLAWRRYRRSPDESSLLPALLLTWLALLGLAESAPLDPYLPTMLAYSCIVRMCLEEGSETSSDTGLASGAILTGLPAEARA